MSEVNNEIKKENIISNKQKKSDETLQEHLLEYSQFLDYKNLDYERILSERIDNFANVLSRPVAKKIELLNQNRPNVFSKFLKVITKGIGNIWPYEKIGILGFLTAVSCMMLPTVSMLFIIPAGLRTMLGCFASDTLAGKKILKFISRKFKFYKIKQIKEIIFEKINSKEEKENIINLKSLIFRGVILQLQDSVEVIQDTKDRSVRKLEKKFKDIGDISSKDREYAFSNEIMKKSVDELIDIAKEYYFAPEIERKILGKLVEEIEEKLKKCGIEIQSEEFKKFKSDFEKNILITVKTEVEDYSMLDILSKRNRIFTKVSDKVQGDICIFLDNNSKGEHKNIVNTLKQEYINEIAIVKSVEKETIQILQKSLKDKSMVNLNKILKDEGKRNEDEKIREKCLEKQDEVIKRLIKEPVGKIGLDDKNSAIICEKTEKLLRNKLKNITYKEMEHIPEEKLIDDYKIFTENEIDKILDRKFKNNQVVKDIKQDLAMISEKNTKTSIKRLKRDTKNMLIKSILEGDHIVNENIQNLKVILQLDKWNMDMNVVNMLEKEMKKKVNKELKISLNNLTFEEIKDLSSEDDDRRETVTKKINNILYDKMLMTLEKPVINDEYNKFKKECCRRLAALIKMELKVEISKTTEALFKESKNQIEKDLVENLSNQIEKMLESKTLYEIRNIDVEEFFEDLQEKIKDEQKNFGQLVIEKLREKFKEKDNLVTKSMTAEEMKPKLLKSQLLQVVDSAVELGVKTGGILLGEQGYKLNSKPQMVDRVVDYSKAAIEWTSETAEKTFNKMLNKSKKPKRVKRDRKEVGNLGKFIPEIKALSKLGAVIFVAVSVPTAVLNMITIPPLIAPAIVGGYVGYSVYNNFKGDLKKEGYNISFRKWSKLKVVNEYKKVKGIFIKQEKDVIHEIELDKSESILPQMRYSRMDEEIENGNNRIRKSRRIDTRTLSEISKIDMEKSNDLIKGIKNDGYSMEREIFEGKRKFKVKSIERKKEDKERNNKSRGV